MTVVSSETDIKQPCLSATSEDSAADLISKQAREETIRLRAYDIYLNRGGEHGSDLEDWHQAEIECFGPA